MSIHIPGFQSLYQLSTWGGLCLAYSRTSVLSPLPWEHIDLWLCGLCQRFLSVFSGVEWVSAESGIYWHVFMVLKELILVQDIHVEFLLGREDLMWWVCDIAEVVIKLEYWENHQFSCRHSWLSSPWPRWIHWIDGNGVMMWCAWSQNHGQTAWIPHHWMEVHCQTWQQWVHLQLQRVPSGVWWSRNDVWRPLGTCMGTCWSNLLLLGVFFQDGLERSPLLSLPKVQEGHHGVAVSPWAGCCIQCMSGTT